MALPVTISGALRGKLDDKLVGMHSDASDAGANKISVGDCLRHVQVLSQRPNDNRFDFRSRHAGYSACLICPPVDQR